MWKWLKMMRAYIADQEPEAAPTTAGIPQDKAREYQQVSGLVCLDLDVLKDISEDPSMSADDLRKQIKLVWDKKESAISDPAGREERYRACCFIFSAAATGMIRCDRFE